MITPCKNICKMENNVCQGCKRTIFEIANWAKFTDSQRKTITERLKNE